MTRRSLLNALVRVLPIPLGLVLSGALVWGASYADWSGNTSNSGNEWSPTSFGLANDSRVPMFRADNLKPGDSGANCIQIKSSATFPTVVKFYVASANWPTNYQSFVDLRIEVGSGGRFGDCAGFSPSGIAFDGTLDTLVALHTDFDHGLGPWTLPGRPPNTISFRFSWRFSPEAPNSAQGVTGNEVTFTWEAHGPR
jgi:hypothetical protein